MGGAGFHWDPALDADTQTQATLVDEPINHSIDLTESEEDEAESLGQDAGPRPLADESVETQPLGPSTKGTCTQCGSPSQRCVCEFMHDTVGSDPDP